MPEQAQAVLLYDGECGLCARSVQFVLRHESPSRREQLRFAPLGGTWGRDTLARHAAIATVDSMLWVRGGVGAETVLTRSDAVIAVLQHVGGVWALAASALRIVPRGLRDWAYDAVAARRTQWISRACFVPTDAQRARFLS